MDRGGEERLKVLITGGAGFIGSWLADLHLKLGHEVVVLDRKDGITFGERRIIFDNPRYKFVCGSADNEQLVDNLVYDCDQVYHLAALLGVWNAVNEPVSIIENNTRCTNMVIEYAAAYDKRLLIASSSEVYGKDWNTPHFESDNCVYGPTTSTRWGYAIAKALDEHLALAYRKMAGLEVIIARLFNIVGPMQMGSYGFVIPKFVRWALDGNPIRVFGSGGQERCFMHVKECVAVLSRLIRNNWAVGEVVNVGSDEPISILNLAARVVELTRSKSKIEFVDPKTVYGDDFEEPEVRVPDIGRMVTYTQTRPMIGIDRIIMDVAEWMRNG